MRIPLIFWVSTVVFIIGLVGGFVITNAYQGQIQALVYLAVVFAFLSWIGSGADLVGLLSAWYDKRSEIDRLAQLAPKLSILFDMKSNPDDFAPAGEISFIPKGGDPISFKRKSIRLKVQNDGGSVAEKCRATISDISRLDGCECPARNTKYLRWLSGEREQDIYPHGSDEFLELAFGDSLEFSPIEAKCKIQDTDKAKLIAWASTPDNLLMNYHNQDGFCSGRFEMVVTVFPKNTDKITRKIRLTIGKSWSDIDLILN